MPKMPKPSMKNALGASLGAETSAFQQRLARADAHAETAKSSADADDVQTDTFVAPVPRVVREAFTIPETEHLQIETIRTQLLSQAIAVNKSEIMRAGLLLLAEADLDTQKKIFDRLERVKTGRPKTI